MDGIRGMKGWRWIFSVRTLRTSASLSIKVTNRGHLQIEGGLTMFLALVSLVLLPSFPDKAKWPKPGHRLYLYQKLQNDHGEHQQEKAHWSTLKHVASDWVFWLQGTVYACNVGTANAVGFFTPTIIEVSRLMILVLAERLTES